MANVTATFTNRAQVDKLVQALQGRGVTSDQIHLSEADGGVRVTVEASDEGAHAIQGMLDDYQYDATAAHSLTAEEAHIEDSGLAAAAAAGAAGATGAAAAGMSSFAGASGGNLAGVVLGAEAAEEMVEEEVDPN